MRLRAGRALCRRTSTISQMGFSGVAITDDLVMGAIRDYCGGESAAPQALMAGADLLIVSQVEVTVGGELAVSVSEAAGTKCPRCWKHSTAADENGLCPRCASVIAKCADFGEV